VIYTKGQIKLHRQFISNKALLMGNLFDDDFVLELSKAGRHRDNVNLTHFPTRYFGFSVFWHLRTIGEIAPGVVGEAGFWKNGWHLDTKGLWNKSQLNEANEYIRSYEPPVSGILDKIKGNRKYEPELWHEVEDYDEWKDVVLVTQKSGDTSIDVVGGYWDFIRKACAYYGDRLLLKAHPKHSATDREDTKEIIKGTGAKYGTLQDLDGCEFALLFNSTISGELFVKNIPIVQYAKGYFHNLDAIHFTDGDVRPPKLRDTKVIAEKTAEFLLWKYCIRPFRGKDDVENFTDMLLEFANSEDEFPLLEKYSYASSL